MTDCSFDLIGFYVNLTVENISSNNIIHSLRLSTLRSIIVAVYGIIIPFTIFVLV